MEVEIKGDIIQNDYMWMYEWLGWDAACPRMIKEAIQGLGPGEQLIVNINSPGGDVMAGQEMYNLLTGVDAVANIQGFAASAAGVVAMGCKTVRMSDVGIIMLHNVSTYGISGNRNDMQRAYDMLESLDATMAAAYSVKSGRSTEEIMEIMDKESWLKPQEALDYGFVDEIVRPKREEEQNMFTNSFGGLRLTPEIMAKVKAEKAEADAREERKKQLVGDLYLYGL